MHNTKTRLALLVGCMALSANLWAEAQPVQATLAGHALLPVKSAVSTPKDAPSDLQQGGTPAANASPNWAAWRQIRRSPDRPRLPIDGQPLQGHSGIKHMPDGTYWVLTDNGFGSKANSPDAMLYLNHYKIDFKDGTVAPLKTIFLHDPDKKGAVPHHQREHREALSNRQRFRSGRLPVCRRCLMDR